MNGKINIDTKDRKLLFELDFNARQSNLSLAKKIGLPEKEVEKRIYRLIQKGVVKGFHPVLNLPKLGYLYCRFLLTLQNCPKEKEEDIIDYLINHPKVFWLFRMQGIYDFLIVMWADSITQFNDFVDEIENKFGKFIKKRLETIGTDIVYFQSRFLTGTQKTKEIHIKEAEKKEPQIDKLDKRILQLLSINARFSPKELSLNIKEKEKLIVERIKRLERIKVIEGYRPLIDHIILGYTWYKIWLNINKTSQKAFRQLWKQIKDSPLTLYTVEGIGLPADLEIEVMVNSNQELFDFINKMRIRFPAMIEDYTTVMFIEALKELYLPFY